MGRQSDSYDGGQSSRQYCSVLHRTYPCRYLTMQVLARLTLAQKLVHVPENHYRRSVDLVKASRESLFLMLRQVKSLLSRIPIEISSNGFFPLRNHRMLLFTQISNSIFRFWINSLYLFLIVTSVTPATSATSR